ncbi:MAG: YqjD family protein [Usitatibacteraceae bacterium]
MSTNAANVEGGVSREKLMQDLRIVVADAEELLRATASQAGEKASATRERIQEHLKAAKERLQDAEDVLVEKTKAAATATDEYVHDHPWHAVGIAAGVGLIVGMLISRGR